MNMCLTMWLIYQVSFNASQMSAEDNSAFSCLYPLLVWMYTRTITTSVPSHLILHRWLAVTASHQPPQHFQLLYMEGCDMVQFHYIALCKAIMGYSSPLQAHKQYSIPLGGIIIWMNPLGRMMWRGMCWSVHRLAV
jgi:hypothetical protein